MDIKEEHNGLFGETLNFIKEIRSELEKRFPHKNGNFTVMIAGTFDILHTGHLYLMKTAASIGRLYVVVARDESVKKIKGTAPILPEKQRLEIVSAIKWVYRAVLGGKISDRTAVIADIAPDLFLLGPNQHADPSRLTAELKKKGLNILFKRFPFMDNRYDLNSSSKIKNKILIELGKKRRNNPRMIKKF